MSWVRIDDRFGDHPKVLAAWYADGASVGLHVMALAYCAGHLTDGLVPAGFVLSRLGGRARTRVPAALVDAGLWSNFENDWRINDYLDFNPSRVEVQEKRAALSETRANAGRMGGNAKQAASKPSSKTVATRAKQTPSPVPVPVTTTTTPSTSADVVGVFDYWRDRTGRPGASLTRQRAEWIRDRMKEGKTVADLQLAVDGSQTAAAVDQRGHRFDGFDNVFRNVGNVERHMERASAKPMSSVEYAARFNKAQENA